MHACLRIILDEHASLSAVLRALLAHLERSRHDGTPPDFALLRTMVFYLDEFPEKRHHAKESGLLFPKLRARTPLSRELIDRLDDDHALGERRIRDLEHALLAFEVLGEARRAAFTREADRYAGFYFEHMTLEERQVLPLAERVLTPRDWSDLDDAFLANRDPFGTRGPEALYEALYERIAAALPGL